MSLFLVSEKFSGRNPGEIRARLAPEEGKMLNYYVFCQTRKHTLVPWTIEALDPPNMTFREFLSKKVDLDGLQLGKTFVGKSKDNLDPVTPDLVAADVIRTFGPFVKYFVEQMTPAR